MKANDPRLSDGFEFLGLKDGEPMVRLRGGTVHPVERDDPTRIAPVPFKSSLVEARRRPQPRQ